MISTIVRWFALQKAEGGLSNITGFELQTFKAYSHLVNMIDIAAILFVWGADLLLD